MSRRVHKYLGELTNALICNTVKKSEINRRYFIHKALMNKISAVPVIDLKINEV